jgi:phosphate transport system substrate-binding protein
MRKIVTAIAALAIGLVLSGPVMAEDITIVGTGDGVKALKAIGAVFSKNNPGITVNVPKSIGSGGGIKAVGTGKYTIGRVAREIKDKEKHYGLTYVPFARIPVVFFVNKGVGIQNLSAQQICDIYSGKITNWKEVGGKDRRIRVVRREDGDSSLKVLLKFFPGFKDITLTPKSKTALKTSANFNIVESKADTIGFGPYDVAKGANVDVLQVDGRLPTEPSYLCVGTIALIFKEKNKTGSIKKFVEFATSPAAHNAIKGAGGLPS